MARNIKYTLFRNRQTGKIWASCYIILYYSFGHKIEFILGQHLITIMWQPGASLKVKAPYDVFTTRFWPKQIWVAHVRWFISNRSADRCVPHVIWRFCNLTVWRRKSISSCIWRRSEGGPDEERNMEWNISHTAAGSGELNFQD